MAAGALSCFAATHFAATGVVLREENQTAEKRRQKSDGQGAGREAADRAEPKAADVSPHFRPCAILLCRIGTVHSQHLPTNPWEPAMAQAPVSPSPRNNSTDELCERVWGRGTLPEAVGGKVGLRNDGANGNLAGHISSRRQYLKANRYVARSADTAEGTTSAIETACRGDRGAASRIRTPMAAATALPLSFAARHVRRVVERPRGNGGQRREREQNRQARSHKAPSPAKVLVHSKHPLGGSIARSQRTQRPFRGAPGAPGSTRRTGAPEQPGGAPGAPGSTRSTQEHRSTRSTAECQRPYLPDRQNGHCRGVGSPCLSPQPVAAAPCARRSSLQ